MTEELKTLKDFIKSLREDISSNWIGENPRKVTVDNALYYVKEFDLQLRQKAIKQIKEFKNKIKYEEFTFNWEVTEAYGKIEWIKNFFNVTEEDLK